MFFDSEKNQCTEDMQIFVNKLDGSQITIDTKTTETIDQVKAKIEEQESIPVDEQILEFEGKKLDDGEKTLQDSGIKHKDTLDLKCPENMFFDSEKNQCTEDMQIFVNKLDGSQITIDTKTTETIDQVKAKIEEQESIPVDEQILEFEGEKLDDGEKTLQDSGIKHKDTLDLVCPEGQVFDSEKNACVEGMIVFVEKPGGDIITINTKPSETIDQVKAKIEEQESIPLAEQILEFEGEKLDDGEKTLEENGIKHRDTLNMLCSEGEFFDREKNACTEDMIIFVNTQDGSTITIETKTTETIDQVKVKVEEATEIPVTEQILEFEGERFDAGATTLLESGIKHKDTLDLVCEDEEIFDKERKVCTAIIIINVIKLNEDVIQITNLTPLDTIDDVKEKIKEQEDIPVEDQFLEFNGVRLEDGAVTLKDYGVENESTLVMVCENRFQRYNVARQECVFKEPTASGFEGLGTTNVVGGIVAISILVLLVAVILNAAVTIPPSE